MFNVPPYATTANYVFLGSVVLWSFSLLWLLGTTVFALLQPLKRRRVQGGPDLPPVSIVVPTSVVDNPRTAADRSAALTSLLSLDYLGYEIIVCVDRGEDDDRLPTELRRSYPYERLRVIVARDQSSANAKVDAMASGTEEAHHELVLFSDDDVLLDPQHLRRLVAQLGDDVGLVSAAAVGTRPENLWGELEVAFMNGQFARLHLAGDFLGYSGALGKSILVRRADLARAGGLGRTGGDCCEDAALRGNFATCGLRTTLGDRPVEQPIGEQRFVEVWRRHRRWLSCRRRYVPVLFVCEGLFSTPLACLAGAVVFNGLALGPATGAAATAVIWCAIDSLFVFLKRWHLDARTQLAWLIRESIFLPLWISALFARTVDWHGRRVPVVSVQPAPR